jgi:hypothetical protein
VPAPVGPECAAGTVSVKSHLIPPQCSVSRPILTAGPQCEHARDYSSATSSSSASTSSGDDYPGGSVLDSSHLEYASPLCVKETSHGEIARPTLLLDPFGLTADGEAQCSQRSEALADEFIWEELQANALKMKLVSLWWMPCLAFHTYRDKRAREGTAPRTHLRK